MAATALSPRKALFWFGFGRSKKAAVIIGVVIGFMVAIQGIAYQKTYADQVSRQQFVQTLSSQSGLGILYGDSNVLSAGTVGYVVYRTTNVMAVLTAVWGLVAITKLLRGSEEDGRWEAVRSGSVTAREATGYVVGGWFLAWFLALFIGTALAAGMLASSGIHFGIGVTIAISLMIFLPGLLFAAAGVVTSQLALTRQRALMYGLVPLVVFFFIRGIGTIQHSLHWLLGLSPFGWSELTNPALDLQPGWLLLFLPFVVLLAWWGLRLAQRDLGSSVIGQSQTVKPRYYLLGNSWQMALRQTATAQIACALVALFVAALMASLSKIAVEATADSQKVSQSFGSLTGSHDMEVAFLGVGLIITVLILMIMSAIIVAAVRDDEAKQYLDNILVQPQRRVSWLGGRVALGLGAVLTVALLSGLVTYAIAAKHNVSLDFAKTMAASVSLIGTVCLLGGFGVLMYGLLPRWAVIAMYAVLVWSFLMTIVTSVAKVPLLVQQTSLFHYTSFNLAAWPDWKAFTVLLAIAATMAAVGVAAFAKRDIMSE